MTAQRTPTFAKNPSNEVFEFVETNVKTYKTIE